MSSKCKDFPKAKLHSEINAHILLNERVEPHFLIHEVKRSIEQKANRDLKKIMTLF